MEGTYGLDVAQETRYGSSTSSLAHAAASLRARAARHGIELQPAAPVDLAAAVVGAESWMEVYGGAAFHRAGALERGATDALLRVLLRSAGSGGFDEPVTDGCAAQDRVLALAMGYARWAERILGSRALAAEALRRAASDLCAAGPATRLGRFAEVLLLTADGLDEALPS